MVRFSCLASPYRAMFRAVGGLLLAGLPLAASAQQLGETGSSNVSPVSVGVALEYATIGGVQLSIPILRPDSASAVAGDQVASNRQIGTGNVTEIGQIGQGNRAGVAATGSYNTATINQSGRNNAGYGTLEGNGLSLTLNQDGNGNRADLTVSGGTGGSLTVQQTGDGNSATGSVPGGRQVSVVQSGNGLSADVSQIGVQKGFGLIQARR